jgi:hypothetical protein
MRKRVLSQDTNVALGGKFASTPGRENAQGDLDQFPRLHDERSLNRIVRFCTSGV